MPILACPKCELALRPVEGGVAAELMAAFGPYQLWSADLWECPHCHNRVICRFGAAPIAEHFEPRYPDGLALFAGKSHFRFWENAAEKAQSVRPQCPYYGMSGQGGLQRLFPSGGNQCALVMNAHAPCQMEIEGQLPNWERCPKNGGGACSGV